MPCSPSSPDELIRQVTLDLPERGLLLLRIRDEIRMTLDAYRALYESSVSFGVRKQLQSEEGLPELAATLRELNEKKALAEVRVLALKSKVRVCWAAAACVCVCVLCSVLLLLFPLTSHCFALENITPPAAGPGGAAVCGKAGVG